MNTKGMKFLAVLAVLAMAFAAFAVMDTEQNSAAIPEEVTTVSTESDFRAAITGDEEFNVKLGANITVNGGMSAYLVKSAGVIDFNGYTVTVKGALNPVKLAQKITLDYNDAGLQSIIVNESSGLTLKDTSEKSKGGIINAYGTNNNAAVLFNAPNGIMTVESGSYKVDNGNCVAESVVTTGYKYWYTVKNLGMMTINGGYFGGMNHYWATPTAAEPAQASSLISQGWDNEGNKDLTTAILTVNGGTFEYGLNSIKTSVGCITTVNGGLYKNPLQYSIMNYDKISINAATFYGDHTGLAARTYCGEELTAGIMEINGNISIAGPSSIMSQGGTVVPKIVVNGVVTTTGSIDNQGVIGGSGEVRTSTGTLTGTAGKFAMTDEVELVFLEGAKVPADLTFGYTDEYGDVHSFVTTAALTVGMGGFEITPGVNKIIVDGTVSLKEGAAGAKYTCTGNVTIGGMVYSDGKTLTLENTTKKGENPCPADIKLKTFQITGLASTPGLVTFSTSVLVEAGCSFYAAGALTIGTDAILKVAEGSVVKAEGTLTVTGKIWNAGQFIASQYQPADDTKLIRVFMNTSYQTGTFYQGSSVYDGTAPVQQAGNAPATVGQTPLTVAFGAYLDMTGIDKVNLTSGGINVDSALYKYNTLILATFNNTIALTASYDNQYPVEVTLDGKAHAAPEKTAKSATFRNVVWDSPMSATLYVTAPEVYTVVLAKTLTPNASPATAATKWEDGFTIMDQNGRVIPIDAATGQIQVVFGYEYTVVGDNSTSNYKFMAPNKDLTDLTKDSKTTGSFTMIRAGTPAVPVVLYITEGFATELTVYLDDNDKNYNVGDVFMYYAVADDKGKPIGNGTAVRLQLDDKDKKVGVITGIYSNDSLLFKSEFVKFYKSTAIAEGKSNIYFPGEPGTAAADTTVPSKEWVGLFTFAGPAEDKTSVSASFTLKCEVDKIDVYFTFGTNTEKDQEITIEFTTYCAKSGHEDTKVLKRTNDTGGADQQFTFKVVVGEVYKVTWTERENYLSDMKSDKTAAMSDKAKTIVQGAEVTVTEVLYYVLSETELKYVLIENNTNADLKIAIGQYSADIPAKGSNNKVIVNADDNTLVLSKKGWTVEGWDFTITYKTGHNPGTKPVHVSGPQTIDTYKGYNDNTSVSADNTIITKITITKADLTMTRYFVYVEKDDHGSIDNWDQNGYMGDIRNAYVSTQYGYTVVDVLYQYQEVDDPEIVVGHATKGTTPEGAEVWTYTMPASNVLLKPIIYKDTRELTFVDQDGVTVETMTEEPTTQINMPVPVKPLCKITDVTTDDLEEDEYNYDAETGYITFEMPDKDVVFTVTYEEIDYSDKVIVTIGQQKNDRAITLVITALDNKMIAPGSIDLIVWYSYVNEFGDLSVDSVEVTKTYEADGSTHYVIIDETFIEELGDNYAGAFAAEGSFELGEATGFMKKTEYNPVLEA